MELYDRLIRLKDAALVSKDASLLSASYDCALDGLVALHEECSARSSLCRDRNVARFLNKYDATVKEVKKLRLSIDDFELKNIIGQGHFGEVCVVSEKATGDVFAMKIMKKAHVLQQADAAFFLEERDIMAQASSNWLTSLHYAFQDKEKLYLVMDFHPGGDLLNIMQRYEGGLSEQLARFYLCEIIAGLHDLHMLGFVHRDVKLENVLVTRSGHIKLIDFGSAAHLDKDGKVVESNLPVGTPEYISPEVLTSLDHGANYGVCCDWWSVGIILYELLLDHTPFEGDSTAETYHNIMSYKTTLKFPAGAEMSRAAKSLIQQLLVDSENRLDYTAIVKHVFFSSVDWDHLAIAIPPFIPPVKGPDDTSNFDSFDPKEDDSFATSNKKSQGFTGKSLPFVGFTFTSYPSPPTTNTDSIPHELVHDLKAALEVCQRECSTAKDKHSALERDCVVYKTQLEDLKRKLDIERHDRRTSDSRALQLLTEVKEKTRVAQDLRQTEAKETQEQLHMVITQLEQERAELSKRVRRLHGDLKKKNIDSDNALGKVADLRNRISQLKEANKKDIASLQTKLTKVTENSRSRIIELQTTLSDAQDKYRKAEKELKRLEELNHSLEEQCNAMKSEISSSVQAAELKAQVKELKKALETESVKAQHSESVCDSLTSKMAGIEEQLKDLIREKAELETKEMITRKEIKAAQAKLNQVSQDYQELVTKCERLSSKKTRKIDEVKEDQVTVLHSEVAHLKKELSEVTSSALRSEELLVEVRKTKQVLEKENCALKEEVTKTESVVVALEDRCKGLLDKLSQLSDFQSQLEDMKAERDEIALHKKKLETEVSALKSEKTKALSSERKVMASVTNHKKQLEEQELSLVLLKRNVRTLEDQLADATAMAEESKVATATLREERRVLESDLEQAESKLRGAFESLMNEKELRVSVEQQIAELRSKMEEVVTARIVEEREFRQLLHEQRQTAEDCSEKLAVVQKDLNLTELKLKETENELSIEKSLSTKIYDDYHSLGREHGKLKAAHLKLQNQLAQQKTQLEEVLQENKEVAKQNVNMAESLALEKVRLQTQTAQFTKLVDYQHSTPINTRASFRKSMRMNRKTRDPEKEIAEWNKLKGISKKEQLTPGTMTSSHQPVSVPCTPMTTATTAISSSSSSFLQQVGGLTVSSGSVHSTTTVTPSQGSATVMDHNIPHKFSLKSGPFHKSCSCSTCKTAIKCTQKLAKCTYCDLAVHQKCISTTPNSCGLPLQLAEQLHCNPPPSKRQRSDNDGKENREVLFSRSKGDCIASRASRKRSLDSDHQSTVKDVCINLVRCSTPLQMTTSPVNMTSFSITSSMLAGSTDESDMI